MFRSLLLFGAAGIALLASPALAQESHRKRHRHRRKNWPPRATASRPRPAPPPTPSPPRTFRPSRAATMPSSIPWCCRCPAWRRTAFGQLHVRGEHNGLQYRLNGIILPEGISVFGQTLDPAAGGVGAADHRRPARRIWQSAPPASSTSRPRAACSTMAAKSACMAAAIPPCRRPSPMAARSGHFNYFVSGDYTTNTLGIESPGRQQRSAPRPHPAVSRLRLSAGHSGPEQQRHRGAGHLQRHLPDSQPGRASARADWTALSAWDRRIRAAAISCSMPMAQPAFRPQNLDERQREITHYGILSYLHSAGSLDYQISAFGRYSSLFFTPGNNVGDILYNGIAQTAYKRDVAYGLQAEGAWHAFERSHHPLRRAVSGRRYAVAHLVAGAGHGARRHRQSQSQSALHRSRPRPARHPRCR